MTWCECHPQGLLRHFMRPEVTQGHQRVFIGSRPLEEGWTMAIIKIEGCTDAAEAAWLGQRIRPDIIEYISMANDEVTPVEAVGVESGFNVAGAGWTVAAFVILASREEAAEMCDFLTAYASPFAK